MANQKHIQILYQGIDSWNEWRKNNPGIVPDLSGEEFVGEDFTGANFTGANLSETDLRNAQLPKAHLENAIIRDAHLNGADLAKADLSGAELYCSWLNYANLRGANLNKADLTCADLSDADLRNADLRESDLYWSRLVRTQLKGTDLSNCKVFGISAWGLKMNDKTKQEDLLITQPNEYNITVDNLEMAQFTYLLLNNEKIRDVIDTVAKKVILILGRFKPERKAVLNAIKDELRKDEYLPVLFDFKGPKRRDLTETVSTLAHMARFVIADITDAKSIIAELEHIVPQLTSVPVQPLILKSYLDSEGEYALFGHIKSYRSVLKVYKYENQADLIKSLEEKVINPAKKEADKIENKLKKARNS
jgi:uncharacterized protein YjbI with pentapeptide repeats